MHSNLNFSLAGVYANVREWAEKKHRVERPLDIYDDGWKWKMYYHAEIITFIDDFLMLMMASAWLNCVWLCDHELNERAKLRDRSRLIAARLRAVVLFVFPTDNLTLSMGCGRVSLGIVCCCMLFCCTQCNEITALECNWCAQSTSWAERNIAVNCDFRPIATSHWLAIAQSLHIFLLLLLVAISLVELMKSRETTNNTNGAKKKKCSTQSTT